MISIILTENIKDAQSLLKTILSIDQKFKSIECYGAKEFKSYSSSFISVKYVFSTWNMPILNYDEIRTFLPNLECIFYAGGTIDYFAKPYKEMGINIISYEDVNAIPVSEFTLAQVLLANKGYFQTSKKYKRPFWYLSYGNARKHAFKKAGNYMTKIGLIGCGNIGEKVAKLLSHFDLEVLIHDPFVSTEKIINLGAKSVSMKGIFMECDVISNHLPDNKDTKDLLSYSLFSLMKSNVTFINTARGKQVVERDLCKAMNLRPYASALLDVTAKEPFLPTSSLLRTKNIFLTPHISGTNRFEFLRIVKSMLISYSNLINKNN